MLCLYMYKQHENWSYPCPFEQKKAFTKPVLTIKDWNVFILFSVSNTNKFLIDTPSKRHLDPPKFVLLDVCHPL